MKKKIGIVSYDKNELGFWKGNCVLIQSILADHEIDSEILDNPPDDISKYSGLVFVTYHMLHIATRIKETHPDMPVVLFTGYLINQENELGVHILNKSSTIVDGEFIKHLA